MGGIFHIIGRGCRAIPDPSIPSHWQCRAECTASCRSWYLNVDNGPQYLRPWTSPSQWSISLLSVVFRRAPGCRMSTPVASPNFHKGRHIDAASKYKPYPKPESDYDMLPTHPGALWYVTGWPARQTHDAPTSESTSEIRWNDHNSTSLSKSPQLLSQHPLKLPPHLASWGFVMVQRHPWDIPPWGLWDCVVVYLPTELPTIIGVHPVSVDRPEAKALHCWCIPRQITFHCLPICTLAKFIIYLLLIFHRICIIEKYRIVVPVDESFQLQMGFSFPFLRANNLRSYILIMRTRSFLLSCVMGLHTQC